MRYETLSRCLVFCISFFIFFSCNSPEKPVSPVAQLSVARDTSAFRKQVDSLSQKISAEPKNASLYHERAKLYLGSHVFERAYEDMISCLDIDTTVPAYFLTLADLYFETGKSGNSKAALVKCLSIDPKNVQANLKMAELYLYVQDYKKSIDYADYALLADIHNPKAYFIKGMVFKESGDTVKAVSSFRTTLDQNPEHYEAYMQLGILFSVKKNPLALQYLNSALALRPSSIEAMYSRAMFWQETQEYNKAIEQYTQILRLDSKNKKAHFNLGFIHQEYLKVFQQAIKHYTDAITCDSNYYEAFFNRGLCYESLGNIAAAAEDYKRALKIKPDYDFAAAGLNRIGK